MPANRKPKSWNMKPQMTGAPELWRNCELAFALWEGSGNIAKDLSGNGNDGDIYTTLNWGLGQRGRVVQGFDGSGPEAITFPTLGIFAPGGNFTAVVVCRANDISESEQWLFHPRAELDITLSFDQDDCVFEFYDGRSNSARLSSVVNEGGISVAIGSWDGEAGTMQVMYSHNGEPVSTASRATGTPNTTNDNNMFGSQKDVLESRAFNGDFYMTLIFSEVWSVDKANRFVRDPFAMLRPAGF